MVGKSLLSSFKVGGVGGAKLSMLRVVSPQKEPFAISQNAVTRVQMCKKLSEMGLGWGW